MSPRKIVAIGQPAVPVIVLELLGRRQEFLQQIAAELLARIGDESVPAVVELARSGEPFQQRAAAQALGEIGASGAALAALRDLAQSSDWQLRAAAVGGLKQGAGPARDLLLTMLTDDDPFVRRKAAEVLSNYREPVAAGALVEFLERSKREQDFNAELAAQQSLQRMARTKRPRSAAAWRAFVAELAHEGERQ